MAAEPATHSDFAAPPTRAPLGRGALSLAAAAALLLISFTVPATAPPAPVLWAAVGALACAAARPGRVRGGRRIALVVEDAAEARRVTARAAGAHDIAAVVPADQAARLLALRRDALDAIVLALSPADSVRVRGVLHALDGAVPDILLATDPTLYGGAAAKDGFGGYAILPLRASALDEWQRLQKALFDRVGAALLLLAAAPLLGVLALLIRLDSPGPVLFRQKRIGLGGRPFRVLKLRTMYHHLADRHAGQQTSRDDPRVTRVGSRLRRTGLDELPQLVNVLRGEMSLVGPRPHAPGTRAQSELLSALAERYGQRHRVRPGITGWAQVNGSRGELRTAEQLRRRLDLDLYYIAHWSLLLDLRILLLTLWREFTNPEAF